ncbi:MAG TPA: GNAT family N-acetyltransferase [Acidimicrobiales bacterium]
MREVTVDDFDAVIALRVADEQADFLYTNVESLAWAYVAPECHPLAIYASGVPVGFASYAYVPADGRCWIVHLMVDERHQRRGIGRAALERLLERMGTVSGGASIAVTVHPENVAAINLYEAFGFTDTGQRQNGEVILRRARTQPPTTPGALSVNETPPGGRD